MTFKKSIYLTTVLGFAILSSCGSDTGNGIAVETDNALREACVNFTNDKRASIDVAPLSHWSEAVNCSDQYAGVDASNNAPHGSFGKCGERAQNTCPGWRADNTPEDMERVLRACLTSMWNEGPGEPYSAHGHYINMSNTRYSKVTCGFHYSNGSLWVNQNFY